MPVRDGPILATMKVILFGGTGMVGQGVLRECLQDPAVTAVLAVGRSPLAQADGSATTHPKLTQLVQPLDDLSGIADRLAGYDACFDCLGVSSTGKKEADYRAQTYDLTLRLANAVAEANPPETVFIYVSGRGTDSTEQGRLMWARVKGATENALLALPLRAVMFRPGIIQPLDGIRSRTPLYNRIYRIAGPLVAGLKRVTSSLVIDTRQVGRAMIAVAAAAPASDLGRTRILDNAEIARAAGGDAGPASG